MKSFWLGIKGCLGRHVGAPMAIFVMLAVMAGGASAQAVSDVLVTVLPIGTTPPNGTTCDPNASGNYMICVDMEPIKTKGSAGGSVAIIWNMGTPGWQFANQTGIYIQKRKNWIVSQTSTTQYEADNTKESKNYEYEINVTNGTESLNWDPTIMN